MEQLKIPPPTEQTEGNPLPIQQPEGNFPSTSQKLWSGLTVFAHNVLSGMEYVGEVVAGIIGLDDSKFQDVIDNMTKEDWMVALEVDRERRLEDAIREALEEESRRYSSVHQTIEDGSHSHALYTETSLPQETKNANPSESDVTEFEILKNVEESEPTFRPDGGFGYLSPEEVRSIKERVTAEFLMKESLQEGRPEPSGPLQDVMMPRDGTTVTEVESHQGSEDGVSLTEVNPSIDQSAA